MIALAFEFLIATAVASAIASSGHPVLAVLAWFLIMGVSNAALEKR